MANELTKQKKELIKGANTAEDPVVRQAYRIHLKNFRHVQRVKEENDRLLRGARGENWDFSRQSKMPEKIHLPDMLDNETDRGKWGLVLKDYLGALYRAGDNEVKETHETLWRIADSAKRASERQMKCDPNELRDLLKELQPRKAPGQDGVPSQLLKALNMSHIKTLAELFTDLANTLDFRPATRPDTWTQALAILIPKETGATSLDRHRTIALMSQVQKLFAKWLMINLSPKLDPLIAENQLGFRRGRQATEAMYTIQKLIEQSWEWEHHLTIMRLDIRKAFDTIHQSSLLKALEAQGVDPILTFNIARELIGNTIQPQIYGCTTEAPVEQQRGTKQGSPESGLLFINAIHVALHPLKASWDANGLGCSLLGDKINHMLFVDDLILLGTDPRQVKAMFDDARVALEKIGLQLNADKTAYLATHPQANKILPGHNANREGLKILGRTFRLGENTDQDIGKKIAGAWSRFNRIRLSHAHMVT